MQKQYFYIVLVVSICLDSGGSEESNKRSSCLLSPSLSTTFSVATLHEDEATLFSPPERDQLTTLLAANEDIFSAEGDATQFAEHHIDTGSENSEDDEEEIMDHTFVALIDIVYTDGSKRSCTGAIIDDNVVVTAAHCFFIHSKPEIIPELTASFVVIGNKKMFDTGYEQYLPIERVLTHPKFEGWSADLSLVFTFAAMTADKPGTVIPLAEDNGATHIDANATVFSWGRYGDENNFSTKAFISNKEVKQTEKQESCVSSESVKEEPSIEDSESPEKNSRSTAVPKEVYEERSHREAHPLSHDRPRKHTQEIILVQKTHHSVERSRTTRAIYNSMKEMREVDKPTKVLSRYLASEDEIKLKPSTSDDEKITERRPRSWQKTSSSITKSLDSYIDSIWDKFASVTRKETETVTETPDTRFKLSYESWRRKMPTDEYEIYKEIETTTEPETEALDTNFKSHYKNWRRMMDTQHNSLLVEIFGFVNNQVCKKLIEKGMSSNDKILQDKNFVCYASEEHLITDRDSGAPVVRRGHLVAVTVGGVECDGDHVGLGMKILCYCPWIAENVPNGKNMTCCKNCCDTTLKKSKKSEHRKRNKYVLR